MKKIENYDDIKVTENKPVLQVGGYECVIKNVKHFEHNGIKKVSLELDIASGEFKDYYQNKYDDRIVYVKLVQNSLSVMNVNVVIRLL